MSMSTHLDIVSLDEEIYCGRAERVFLTGTLGDLEVAPGHAPLLTELMPGPVRIRKLGGAIEVVYVSGGLLEVQPEVVTVLADTVVRAKDLDEAEALQKKADAKRSLDSHQSDVDYARVRAELIRAVAMLRAIRHARQYHSK